MKGSLVVFEGPKMMSNWTYHISSSEHVVVKTA